MKIFTRLTAGALLCCAAIGANAQALGEGMVINPFPPAEHQTFLATVSLVYDFKLITMVNPDMTVPVSFGGETYNVNAEVYFDPEIAWDFGQVQEDPAVGNVLIVDFSEEAYAAGYPVGKYEISIPAGIVQDEEGQTNSARTITFTKVNPVSPVSVTPANGMYQAGALSDIRVTFDDAVTLNPEGGKITVRKKDDWLSDPTYVENYEIAEDGKTLSFALEGLPKGVLFSVEVPQGFLLVGENYINATVWLEYMVWDGMDAATVISAPEHETSPALNPFILTWDCASITMNPVAPGTEFVCGFPDYGLQDGWRIYIPASAYRLVHVDSDGTVTEEISAAAPANGIYLDVTSYTEGFEGYRFEIFFPAGLVVNEEGKENPPFSYAFTVLDVWPDPSFSADAGIITVAWPSAEWVTYNLSEGNPVLTDGAGASYTLRYTYGHTSPGEVTLLNSNNVHGLEIDLGEIDLPDGNYTLTIPQGYVLIDGAYGVFVMNGTARYQFGWKDGRFTGYNRTGITTDNEVFNVYDLNGRKVKVASDLDGLEKGIYIINGKKIKF